MPLWILKVIILFLVAFSLISLAGTMAKGFSLPTVSLANAVTQNCQTHNSSGACSEFWYPAGPAENTLFTPIFSDFTSELLNLEHNPPSIDLTDQALPVNDIQQFTQDSNYLITAPEISGGYYEIQFHQGNNFWGCPFLFGTSSCGVQVRQGIAHMIDKNSFAANEPDIVREAAPVDNPLSTNNVGSLPSPNPCSYDASFPETNATTGNQCVTGSPGGTAYHLAPSGTGADGFAWLPAPGSKDLNAAAQHFVNAGVATGFNPTTSVLTGITPAASEHVPNFVIRIDAPPLEVLGKSLAAEICYLFTGSYTVPCTYLHTTLTVIQGFSGLTTSTTMVSLNWSMYTSGSFLIGNTDYSDSNPTHMMPIHDPFDTSLYPTFNSRFVSGVAGDQPPNGTCSNQAVPTADASDYEYICVPSYDTASSEMENAQSLGQAVTYGLQAESVFGANVLTLPVFELTTQFTYLNNGWARMINNSLVGLPNYFTWLNARNPTPVSAGAMVQGLSEDTSSVNPYIASTFWDLMVVGNVYDTLFGSNPLSPGQLIDWMTISAVQKSNSSLTYAAPPHTLTTYSFTLRNDLYFQDGRAVTAYDVAFSYLSMVGTGAFLGTGATSMTGITVLSPHQFDIGVNSLGVFNLGDLTGLPIVSGRYWTSAGSSVWDSVVKACLTGAGCGSPQFTPSGLTPVCIFGCGTVTPSLMTIASSQVVASYDPLANNALVGSGPWECAPVTTSGNQTTCSSTGAQNPGVGGVYELTRFGNGLAPGSSVQGIYFRSSGDLALSIWSGMTGGSGDFTNFTVVAACDGLPVTTTGACAHFQQGIGAPLGGGSVGSIQIGIVARFYGVNWVAPFSWTSLTGIGSITPVLYEGSATINPASTAGCSSAYPTGGYDC